MGFLFGLIVGAAAGHFGPALYAKYKANKLVKEALANAAPAPAQPPKP